MQDNSLSRAIHFAAGVHGNQYDKGGEPYILHCIRVMQKIRTDDTHTRVVAMLHDTIEDVTTSYLKYLTSKDQTPGEIVADEIEDHFGLDILKCVENLTHGSEDYLEEYIPRVTTCASCAAVKMADLEDNLNPLRQPKLRDKDLLRLQKYHMAYRLLRGDT